MFDLNFNALKTNAAMSSRRAMLNWFFYLAPLWLVVETFIWPGFRAGLVTGGGFWLNVLFYAVEGGLGAALWYGLPYAGTAALAENVIYLILAAKFIMFAPLDIAMSMDTDMGRASAMFASYKASLPGILFSTVKVTFEVKRRIAVR